MPPAAAGAAGGKTRDGGRAIRLVSVKHGHTYAEHILHGSKGTRAHVVPRRLHALTQHTQTTFTYFPCARARAAPQLLTPAAQSSVNGSRRRVFLVAHPDLNPHHKSELGLSNM